MAFFVFIWYALRAEIIRKIDLKFYKSIFYKFSCKYYSNFPQSDTLFGR